MTLLLHMTTRALWAEAVPTGRYAAASVAEEGFIHLSTTRQVQLPATALFRGRSDIVLLCIDADRLDAVVLWEPGDPADPEGMRFPHLYGTLPVSAVRAVVAYRPAADGTFATPTGPGGRELDERVLAEHPPEPGGQVSGTK